MSLLGALVPASSTVQHRPQLEDGGDGPRWAEDLVDVEHCRVELVSKRVQLDNGRVVVLSACIFWPGAVECRVGDKVVLKGTERLVQVVDELAWFDGTVMHREVWTT